MSEPKPKPKRDMNERHELPLDPEAALKALLKVDPESEPVEKPENDESPAE